MGGRYPEAERAIAAALVRDREAFEQAQIARSWWKQKRWWAAGLLWLLVVYPLSIGPLHYAHTRGWMSPGVADATAVLYLPLGLVVVSEVQPFSRLIIAHGEWWEELARRHARAAAAGL